MDEGATEWRLGPEFPHAVRSTSLVSYHDGSVIVIGGCDDADGPLDTFYRLPHANADAWALMDQRLSSRQCLDTFAFLVSDDVCQVI